MEMFDVGQKKRKQLVCVSSASASATKILLVLNSFCMYFI